MASSGEKNVNWIRKKAYERDSGPEKAQNVTFPTSVKCFSGPFPLYREPTKIGCFSLDGARQYRNDNSQMKYISMEFQNLPCHLSEGYSKAIRKDVLRNEKLDNILRWITLNRSKVLSNFPPPPNSNKCFGADFVCYRGLLTSVLCSPYEYKEDWIICATKFRGTIYLCTFPTPQKIQSESNKTGREDLMCFWGYKFEQFMTSSTPKGPPDLSVPVNENEEYCVVAKGKLNEHYFLFSAEVDGVDTSYVNSVNDKSMKQYLELKTTRFMVSGNRALSFMGHKVMKWWAQSFLIGIPKIMCGFRDDDGMVTKIEVFETKTLAAVSKDKWSPASMMICCDQFLNFVRKHVTKDDPNVVYKFYHVAGQDVSFEELPASEEYQILPKWYLSSWVHKETSGAVWA